MKLPPTPTPFFPPPNRVLLYSIFSISSGETNSEQCHVKTGIFQNEFPLPKDIKWEPSKRTPKFFFVGWGSTRRVGKLEKGWNVEFAIHRQFYRSFTILGAKKIQFFFIPTSNSSYFRVLFVKKSHQTISSSYLLPRGCSGRGKCDVHIKHYTSWRISYIRGLKMFL